MLVIGHDANCTSRCSCGLCQALLTTTTIIAFAHCHGTTYFLMNAIYFNGDFTVDRFYCR